jgi:hypothetical protein
MRRALALLLAPCLLAGCSQGEQEAAPVETKLPKSVAREMGDAAKPVDTGIGTPLAERVATLGLLNKRNNISQDIQLKPGEARRVGNVIVKLASCEKTAPWERPPETGAFVQVWVKQRKSVSEPLRWRKVFSGWLFRNSPSLNVVEHPVYDVWVKDCAMNFPGDDAPLPDEKGPAKPASAPAAADAAAAQPAPAPAPAADSTEQ